MSLLLMSTEPPPSRPTSAWRQAASLFRTRSQLLRGDQQPTSASGHLSPPELARSRSNSTSRSINSIGSRSKEWIGRISGRSSPSLISPSVDGGRKPLTDEDFKVAEDLFEALEKYNELITNEVSMDRDFPEKRLSGMQKVLKQRHGCDIISDLPETLFDMALLWCPAGDLTRSADANEPSWSWRGWNGPVNFPFDPLTCPDLRKGEAPETFFKSFVKSFNLGPASGKDMYTIRNRPELRLQRRIEYNKAWTPSGNKIPTSEKNTLRFKTHKISAASFDMEQLYHYEDKNDHERLICTGLTDSQGRRCGAIMDYEKNIRASEGELHMVLLSVSPHIEWKKTKHPSNTSHCSGIPIWHDGEFSRGEEIEHTDESFATGPTKMYNVMLIQDFDSEQSSTNANSKKQPISRRVAVGRIHEDAWKAANPEFTDIVLQ